MRCFNVEDTGEQVHDRQQGGQGDQSLQGAGVGRRMGAGVAGQLLSEFDGVLMCSSF